MLTLRAYAKLNLVLEVLGRRSDGYHDISSIMQTISMHDVLTLEPAERIGLKLSLSGVEDRDNLALQAAHMLGEVTGCKRGVVIGLEKHIPAGAGLGGGSSDAAAVLRGLNILWRLGLTAEKLAAIGAGIGSDVPFFIYGGACLVEGRGERVTLLEDLGQTWFVLLKPEVPIPPRKTAALYGMLPPAYYSDGAFSARMRPQLESGTERGKQVIFNVFEKVMSAAYPGLDMYINEFCLAGASKVHLAGSGPVLFTMLNGNRQASDIHAALLARKLEAYIVTSVERREIDR
ncbi:MAG: 4-(cytidine 5'-diphospho)-2-C-methyl-D-erythritol kinase [Dehalococcoidia bacterium]|nr:4-(cytidine 5'-diphospho)-2-C-methyl-D-erythritol kinase [Dehalococcoidia bacterium]